MLIGFTQVMNAQVKIGGDVTVKADTSAVLELQSSNRGLLLPRLTTAEINAIVTPATGLLVFNLDLNVMELNLGTTTTPQWVAIVTVPVVTNATLPATPFPGMIRFNSDTKTFEGWNGSAWVTL